MHDAAWVGGTNGHGHGDPGGPGEFSRRLPFACISPLAEVPSESVGHICLVHADSLRVSQAVDHTLVFRM